jgi:large conductance mechanosensitive channel
MLEEFKKFALRGNVVDLAIGVIIGAAFGSIVSSLVGDIIMPLIGAITGGLDFTNYFVPLSSKVTAATLVEAKKQGAVLAYGSFLTVTLNFIIIAFVLFLDQERGRKGPARLQARTAFGRDQGPPEEAINRRTELNRPFRVVEQQTIVGPLTNIIRTSYARSDLVDSFAAVARRIQL